MNIKVHAIITLMVERNILVQRQAKIIRLIHGTIKISISYDLALCRFNNNFWSFDRICSYLFVKNKL